MGKNEKEGGRKGKDEEGHTMLKRQGRREENDKKNKRMI